MFLHLLGIHQSISSIREQRWVACRNRFAIGIFHLYELSLFSVVLAGVEHSGLVLHIFCTIKVYIADC